MKRTLMNLTALAAISSLGIAACARTDFETNPAGKKLLNVEGLDANSEEIGGGNNVMTSTAESLIGAAGTVVNNNTNLEQQQQGLTDTDAGAQAIQQQSGIPDGNGEEQQQQGAVSVDEAKVSPVDTVAAAADAAEGQVQQQA